MTHKNFVCSDHHLGHGNILTFTHDDKPLRPFDSLEEMHEVMIQRHNHVVRPMDRVYFLGDVVINRKYLYLLSRFNGRKVLVRGNHDICKLKEYAEYFEDVRGVAVKPRVAVLTHVPIHPDSFRESWPLNVHGHLHANTVKVSGSHYRIEDKRYVNVSMEQINYTPVDLDDIVARGKP